MYCKPNKNVLTWTTGYATIYPSFEMSQRSTARNTWVRGPMLECQMNKPVVRAIEDLSFGKLPLYMWWSVASDKGLSQGPWFPFPSVAASGARVLLAAYNSWSLAAGQPTLNSKGRSSCIVNHITTFHFEQLFPILLHLIQLTRNLRLI